MKILYSIFICVFLSLQLAAQNGLERIIVEKYYVSDENDTTVNDAGGVLPVNSVTYRVYVDMLPGYIFQAAFGTPEHELKIATSTKFFNNQDRGARFPTYTRTQASKNTVMLDSWLSCGAGLKDNAGVLKEKDNGLNTIVNADDILRNEHPQAGIPLTSEDGVMVAATEPVTVVGFFDTDLSVFDDANEAPAPNIVSTHDGAWSSLNGSVGPDPADNIVLIGQFTTDGVFEFELNLQIRNQTTLVVEKYVARNPLSDETQFEELIHIDSLQVESATHDLIDLNDQVSVYPMPTSGHLSIEIDDQVNLTGYQDLYRLHALDGSMLSGGNITDHLTSLDFSSLLPGIYILSLELENKYQYTKKIVILR